MIHLAQSFFSWASTTVIRFLISLAVSKIYSWQYSGLLARARISDPIRWHNWPLILNMQGPWPSLTAFMTLTPIEVMANIELYRLMLSKKCLDSEGYSHVKRRSKGCGGGTYKGRIMLPPLQHLLYAGFAVRLRPHTRSSSQKRAPQ